MPDKNKISSIVPLNYKYAVITEGDIPPNMKPFPINFKVEEIQKFEVLFFHRLLKKIFGSPSKVQYDIFQDNEKVGTVPKRTGFGREWTYYFRTDNGVIIQFGTRDYHNFIDLFLMIPIDSDKPIQTSMQAAETFVNDILREANRVKNDLLNPLKEFEQAESIQVYFLYNIYLQNYSAAEWLLENVEDLEEEIGAKILEWRLPDPPFSEDEQTLHDKDFACAGLFYNSIVMYQFMALEGFINLIYHALLKSDLRKNDTQLEERLDIDLKVLLIHQLCRGFKKGVNRHSGVYSQFAKLKDFRNKIFHSGIVDALKRIVMLEGGFLYSVETGRFRQNIDSFPFARDLLGKDDVLRVKNIVDSLIKEIIGGLEEGTKELVSRYILNHLRVPFTKDSTGQIHLGFLEEGK